MMNTPGSSSRRYTDVFRVRVSPSRSNTPAFATPPPPVPLAPTSSVGETTGSSHQIPLEKAEQQQQLPQSPVEMKSTLLQKAAVRAGAPASLPQNAPTEAQQHVDIGQYAAGAAVAVAAVSSVHSAFTSTTHSVVQRERHESARRVVYEVSSTSSEGVKEHAQNPPVVAVVVEESTPAANQLQDDVVNVAEPPAAAKPSLETPVAVRAPLQEKETENEGEALSSPIVVLTDFDEERASEAPSEVKKDDAEDNDSLTDPDESIATHVTNFVEGTQRVAEMHLHLHDHHHQATPTSPPPVAQQHANTKPASKSPKRNDVQPVSTRRPLRYAANEKDNSDSDSFVGFFKKRNDTDESGASFPDTNSVPFPAGNDQSPDIRLASARAAASAEQQAMFRTPPAASTSTGRPDPRSDTKRGGSMDLPTPVEIPRNTYSVGSTATSTAGRIVSLPDESPFGFKSREAPRRRPTRELPPDMFVASSVTSPSKSATTHPPSSAHPEENMRDARVQSGATPTYTAMQDDIVYHSPTASEPAALASAGHPVSSQTTTNATRDEKAPSPGATESASQAVQSMNPPDVAAGRSTPAVKGSSIGSGGSTPTPRGVMFHLPQPVSADLEGRNRYPDVVRSQNSFVIPGDTSPSLLQLQFSSPASAFLHGSSVKDGSSVRPDYRQRQSQPFFFTEEEKMMHEYGSCGNLRIHRTSDGEQRSTVFAPRMYSDVLEKYQFGDRTSESNPQSNGNSFLDVQDAPTASSQQQQQQRVGPPTAEGRRPYTYAESIDVSRDIQHSIRKSMSAVGATSGGAPPAPPQNFNPQRRRTTQHSHDNRPPHQPPLVPPLALSGHTRRDFVKAVTENVAGDADAGSHNSSAMGLAVHPKRLFGQPPTSSSSLSSPGSDDSANQTMNAATETRVPRPSTFGAANAPATPVQRESSAIKVLSIGKEDALKQETVEDDKNTLKSSVEKDTEAVQRVERREPRQAEPQVSNDVIATESRRSAKEEERLLQKHLDRKERETLSRCLRTWYRCMFERAVSLETTKRATPTAEKIDGKEGTTQDKIPMKKSLTHVHGSRHRGSHGHHHHGHSLHSRRAARSRNRTSSRSGGDGSRWKRKNTRSTLAISGSRSQSTTSTSTDSSLSSSTSSSSASSPSSTFGSKQGSSTSTMENHPSHAHHKRYHEEQGVMIRPSSSQRKGAGRGEGTTIAKETITSFASVFANVDEAGRARTSSRESRGRRNNRRFGARKETQPFTEDALQQMHGGQSREKKKIDNFHAVGGGREIEVGKTYVDWKIRRNRSSSAGARKKKPVLSSRLDKVISRLSGDLQARVRAVLRGDGESEASGHNSDSQETSSGSVEEANEMLHTARITAMMLKGNLEDLSDEDLARWFMFPRTQQLLRELREMNGGIASEAVGRISAQLTTAPGSDAAQLLRQILQSRNGRETEEPQRMTSEALPVLPSGHGNTEEMHENEHVQRVVAELHDAESDAAHGERSALASGSGVPHRRKTAAYASGTAFSESVPEPIAFIASGVGAGGESAPVKAFGSVEQHNDGHVIQYSVGQNLPHKAAEESHGLPIAVAVGSETAQKLGEASLSPLTPVVVVHPEFESRRAPEAASEHAVTNSSRGVGSQGQRGDRKARPSSPQYGTSSPSSSSYTQDKCSALPKGRVHNGGGTVPSVSDADPATAAVAPGQFYYKHDGKYVLLKNPALAAKHLKDEFGKPARIYAVVSRQRASPSTRFRSHDACDSARRNRSPAYNHHHPGQRRKLISVQAWESLPLTEPRSPLGPPRINPYCEVCVARYNLILVDENMNPVPPLSAVTSRGTSPGKLTDRRSATPTSRSGAQVPAQARSPQRQATPEARKRKILLSDGVTYLMLPYSVTSERQKPASHGRIPSQDAASIPPKKNEGVPECRVRRSQDDSSNLATDVSQLPPPPPVFLETQCEPKQQGDSPAEPLIFSDTRRKVGALDVGKLRHRDAEGEKRATLRRSAPLSSKPDATSLNPNTMVSTPSATTPVAFARTQSDARTARESRRLAERKEKKRQLAIIARQLLADYAAEHGLRSQKDDSPTELEQTGRKRRAREYDASPPVAPEQPQNPQHANSPVYATATTSTRSTVEVPRVQPNMSENQSSHSQSKFNPTLERAVKMRMKNLLWHELPLRRDQNQWDEYFTSLNEGLNALKALKVAHMSNH